MAGERFERDYQLDLLGSLTTQERLSVAVEHVRADMFDETLQPIAEIVLTALQKYRKPLSINQLRRKLQSAGLGKVRLKPSKAWEFDRDEIIKFAQFGTWRSRLITGMSLLDGEDYGKLDALFAQSTPHVNGKFERLSIRDLGVEELTTFKRRPIRCGLSELDRVLGGGVSSGELAVVLAATNVGKSRWLVFVGGTACLQGKRVLHITLEEPKDRCFNRYVARLTGMTEDDLAALPPKQRLVARDRAFTRKRGNVEILDSKGESIRVGDVDRQLQAGKFDLLIIDYGDRLTPDARYDEKRHEYGQVFEDMKSMAQRQRIPVWTATQARREAYDKTILGLDDTSESLTKVKVADFMITLGVERAVRGLTDTSGWSRMIVFVAKNRGGPANVKIRCMVNLGMSQWIKQ